MENGPARWQLVAEAGNPELLRPRRLSNIECTAAESEFTKDEKVGKVDRFTLIAPVDTERDGASIQPGHGDTETVASWQQFGESESEHVAHSQIGDSFTIGGDSQSRIGGDSFTIGGDSYTAENMPLTKDELPLLQSSINTVEPPKSSSKEPAMSISSFFGLAKTELAGDIENGAISSLKKQIASLQEEVKSQQEQISSLEMTIKGNDECISVKTVEISAQSEEIARQRNTISLQKDELSAKTWAIEEYNYENKILKLQADSVPFLYHSYLGKNQKANPLGMKYATGFQILNDLVLTSHMSGDSWCFKKVLKRIGELDRLISMLTCEIDMLEKGLEAQPCGKRHIAIQTDTNISSPRGKLNLERKISRLMSCASKNGYAPPVAQEAEEAQHQFQKRLEEQQLLMAGEIGRLTRKKLAGKMEKQLLIFIATRNANICNTTSIGAGDAVTDRLGVEIPDKVERGDAMPKQEVKPLAHVDSIVVAAQALEKRTIDKCQHAPEGKGQNLAEQHNALETSAAPPQNALVTGTTIAAGKKGRGLGWLQNRPVEIIDKKRRNRQTSN